MKKILFLALALVAFGALLSIQSPREARAQAAQVPPNLPGRIYNTLLDPIERLDGDTLVTDETETGQLQSIFADSDGAIRAVAEAPDAPARRAQIQQAELDELENFIIAHPQSAWASSLHHALAKYYRPHGQISLCLLHWESAWLQTRDFAEGPGKQIADSVLAYWTRLLASLGRVETLAELIQETEGRVLDRGPLSHKWARTREAYAQMLHSPGSSYRCGTFALANPAHVSVPGFQSKKILNTPSPETGFSVQDLVNLSIEQNLGFVAVARHGSESIVVPSVVLWRESHYAAITRSFDDPATGVRYEVIDPTFEQPMYLTASEINLEASGAFLIPQNQFPVTGFTVLTEVDARSLFGRGNPNFFGDPDNQSCNGCSCPPGGSPPKPSGPPNHPPSAPPGAPPPGAPGSPSSGQNVGTPENNIGRGETDSVRSISGGGCDGCGMASWSVAEPYINTWLRDTPLFYRPSRGNPVRLDLAYKQRDETDNSGPWYTSFGLSWNCNYVSYVYAPVQSETLAYGADVYLGGGGASHFNAGATRNYYNNYELSWTWDAVNFKITEFQLNYTDGSKDVYGFRRVDDDDACHYWFLTKKIDPAGNEIQFEYPNYNSTDMNVKLERIRDVDNNVTTITYITGTCYVDTVSDPASRSVSSSYTTDGSGNKLLHVLTDPVGIQSTFTYDGDGWPSTLVTPYGTTSFSSTDSSAPGGFHDSLERQVTITHPDTSKERYLFYSDQDEIGDGTQGYAAGQVPSGTPLDTFENSYTNVWNSFHWSRQAYAALSSTFKSTPSHSNMNSSDWRLARWRHWLGGNEYTSGAVDTLSLQRDPTPDGSTEGQKTWYDYTDKGEGLPERRGLQIMPAVIARVMPDTTTWYQWMLLDDHGRVVTNIEKWVSGGTDFYRTNRYVYAGNGTDVLEHYQTHGSTELRVQAWDYNSYHQPLHFTNALSEVTTYTYDGSKRLSTVTTPAGLLSTYTYGSDGYPNHVIDSISGTPLRTNGWSWSNAQLATSTNEMGLKLSYTWDALNRVTQISFPDSTTILNKYTNGSGAKILEIGKTTDRLGKSSYFIYNNMREITDIQDALGHITHYDYCTCGSPEYIKRAYGTGVELVTQNVFDYQGNITQTYFPGSVAVTNYYDTLRRLTKRTDFLSTNTYTYDNLNRLLTATNAVFGQVRKNVWNPEGTVATSVDQNGVSISNTYDNLDRLRTRTYPDSGVEAFGYTANYNEPTSYTNQISKVTSWAYDAAQRKTGETIVGIMATSFAYDSGNNLLTLTDGNSHNTTWTYDIYAKNLTKADHASTIILTNGFDANGRLTARWSKAKGKTSYTYDDVGNLTAINYPTSTDISYTYDALNRISTMVDAVGTNTITYASNGQLATEGGYWGSGTNITDTITNSYNSAGLRNALDIKQPTSYWHQDYSYDAASRLSAVNSANGNYNYYYHPGLSSVTAASRLIHRISLPNTSFITNFYDTSARLTETDLKNSSGTALNKHAYVYNTANQRTKQTFTDGGYFSYLYNDAGELYSSISTNSVGAEVAAERFGYALDAGWNVTKTTNNTTVTTYTINNLNQVTSGGISFTYDTNGNREKNTSTGLFFEYDDENQLSIFTITNSARTLFIYDGKQRSANGSNIPGVEEPTTPNQARHATSTTA